MTTTTTVAIDTGAAAATPAAHGSDSDNECPNKEPEFVVDITDDGHQPLPPILHCHQLMMDDMAPAVQQRHQQQLAPASLFWPEQYQEPPPPPEHYERECDVFIIKIFCSIAAMILAGVTLMMAMRLPTEYTTKGGGQLLILCPILFGGFALSWLMISKLDRDEKRKNKQQGREVKSAHWAVAESR